MKLNLFPVVGMDRILRPWNIHRLNLSRLPTLDLKATKLSEWLNPHVGSMMSSRERSLRKKNEEDALMFIKDTLHTILVRSSGIQGGRTHRLFALRDNTTKICDTILFINGLKFDLHSHTIVCDGYVLTLTPDLLLEMESVFATLVLNGDMMNVAVMEDEMQTWKQLLPAFVERCRSSWNHGENCEYKSQGKTQLTQIMEVDPLCSCGRGKDVEGMSKDALWRVFAPYVTRVAMSPLFAVSYLESVGRNPEAYRCALCRGKGKPKPMTCVRCKKVRYCSRECQKKDWKTHKKQCKP
jgi:MYND finger